MTTQEEHLETRITELEIELEQAQERIGQLEEELRYWNGVAHAGGERNQALQRDLDDMTKLACDYKEANTRLENDYREYIEANYVSKASLESQT